MIKDSLRTIERLIAKILRFTIRRIIPDQIWEAVITKNKLRIFGRPYNPEETSKARSRREREGFFEEYCQGSGIDIGYGGDLVVEGAFGWDLEHGDAQFMESAKDNTFDFVYSSHLLEHMQYLDKALLNWYRITKEGGYLIIFVPHRDLYEKKKTLPSRFNEDHKHFFLLDEDDPPDTLGIVPLIEKILPSTEIVYAKICDEGFVNEGDEIHSRGEYSIEIVCKKRVIS